MKFTAIGVGNAFSYHNFNQQFVLEEDGRRLLVDCGCQTQFALKNANLRPQDIDDIYVSHAHADHCGGLEFMAFTRYDWAAKPQPRSAPQFQPPAKAPRLLCERGLMDQLWSETLMGGLKNMAGFKADLGTFFIKHPIDDLAEGFEWQGWHVCLIQQIHIMAGSTIQHTYGLFLTKPGHKKFYITTDSQHCSPSQVEVFYDQADVIIQDCECNPFPSGVHASYPELAGHPDANARRLSEGIRAKMWLSHYGDHVGGFILEDGETPAHRAPGRIPVSKFSPYGLFHPVPAVARLDGVKVDTNAAVREFDWEAQAKKDGFAGFLKVGQVMEF